MMQKQKNIFYIITSLFIFFSFIPKVFADGEVIFGLNSISSKAGQEAVLVLSQDTFTNSSPEVPATYSFRVTYTSTDFSSFVILPGSALGATPSKSVSCSVVSAGVYDCQIIGDTSSTIGDGPVALLVFTTTSGLSDGDKNVALSNVVATGITPDSNVLANTPTDGVITIDSTLVPVIFTIASGSGLKNTTVDLNIYLNKTGTTETPDALLWDVIYNPIDISAVELVQIPAMQSAGVDTTCYSAAPGDYKCTIPSGYSVITDNNIDFVTIRFTISNSTILSSIPIRLSGAISISSETGSYQPTQVASSTILVLVDSTAPTVPASLSATVISTTAIDLSWAASTDDVAVTGYKIFRNSVEIGTSVSTSYSNTGLSAATAYTYTVSAYDAIGNESAQSSAVSATTQTPPVVVNSSGGSRSGGGGGGGRVITNIIPSTYGDILGGRSIGSFSIEELKILVKKLTIMILQLQIKLLQMKLSGR